MSISPFQIQYFLPISQKAVNQRQEKLQNSSENGNKRDQIISSAKLSNSTKTVHNTVLNGENNKKWSFDEGPCPCTNGSIKNKPDIITTSAKTNTATSAVDVCPSEEIRESSKMTNVDDEDGYDGEGDRLLIADLTPICSTVKYYLQ